MNKADNGGNQSKADAMRTNLLLTLANWWKQRKKARYEAQAEYHRVKAATYERCIPDNGEKVTGSLVIAIAHHTASEAKYRSLAKSLVTLALLFPVGVWGQPCITQTRYCEGVAPIGNPWSEAAIHPQLMISTTEEVRMYGAKTCTYKDGITTCIPTSKPTESYELKNVVFCDSSGVCNNCNWKVKDVCWKPDVFHIQGNFTEVNHPTILKGQHP